MKSQNPIRRISKDLDKELQRMKKKYPNTSLIELTRIIARDLRKKSMPKL